MRRGPRPGTGPHPGASNRAPPDAGQPRKDGTTTDYADDGFEQLLQHIKDDRGFDFAGYERESLARRVQGRMDAIGLSRYDEYLDHLLLHPEEITQLFELGPDAAGHETQVGRLRPAALMSSAAAQLVLDDEGRLAVCNHRAMDLLALSERDLGRPLRDLEVSYRPLELRGHIDEAIAHGRSVWVRDVELIRSPAERNVLDVEFVPLTDEGGTHLGVTVLFNDVTQHRQLQDELLYTSRQLETAYEELQSTNEELATTNEELRSMNDVLHQSHQALRERQDDLDRLNRFMTSVLSNMKSGVVVVDSALTVLAWSSMAEELWGIRTDQALGAHLMNLDIGLPVEQLRQPIRSQLRKAGSDPRTLVLDAVDRHGRTVRVQVTLTSLHDHGSATPAAVIAMEARPDSQA